jgi:hypothetical protein
MRTRCAVITFLWAGGMWAIIMSLKGMAGLFREGAWIW